MAAETIAQRADEVNVGYAKKLYAGRNDAAQVAGRIPGGVPRPVQCTDRDGSQIIMWGVRARGEWLRTDGSFR